MNNPLTLNSPHKDFEGIKKIDEFGIEYWEARELMPLLGYSKWSNFNGVVIEKAKTACKNSDQAVKNHFADIGKMINNTLQSLILKILELMKRKQLI
jgi:DNA-damage-inducible protein D